MRLECELEIMQQRNAYWGMIAVAVVALILLENADMQNRQLANNYNDLVAKYNSLIGKYNSLLANYTVSSAAANQTNRMYEKLLQNYTEHFIVYRGPASNQSIPIWGKVQYIKPNGTISWGLLDTFDNHIMLDTNQSVKVIIVDLYNFVNFVTQKPYFAVYSSNGVHFERDERISQGCAVYVLVIVNPSHSTVEVRPNVTATYAPTAMLTGVCSLP